MLGTRAAVAAGNRAPQPPQNLSDGWFSKPHSEQATGSGAPQSAQNRRPEAFSFAHPEQRIAVRPAFICPHYGPAKRLGIY
jgi:hypothetical protein